VNPELNGKRVQAFEVQMANLGFARLAEELLTMLEDGAWQEFSDGIGTYRFLPGEFDYFLTQRGVERDFVMRGVQDLDIKARLEQHMDERRTAEDGYRRPLDAVRSANPERPGRPIKPFGVTEAQAKAAGLRQRPALGRAVRRVATSGEPQPDSKNLWRVRWSDDKTVAEAIVAKLLQTPELAADVYRRLHAGMRTTRSEQDRRSTR
jgi:hypothetical protein